MKRVLLALCAAACLVPVVARTGKQAAFGEISLSELRDRIEGGWAGQMIGVSYGAPTEFRWREEIIPEDKMPVWKPEMISNAIGQDDLYVDMTFAKVLEDKGLDATTEDFGNMFRDAKYALWHANLAARRALKRGVPPALSGTPKYNAHANDIDFQIEADFVGVITPGMPQASNDLCWRAGRVMNYGDGIYGGMFVSAMYSAAFFEKDPRKLVEAGLAVLPPKSPYAMLISDLLAWSKQNPGEQDWIKVWNMVEKKWNKREPCPDGALAPFNIDAKINGAYIALGMLYGGGDIEKTMNISTRCGQDSDCNPASAIGVLGVAHGYKALPAHLKAGIPAIADKKFSYTDYSFRTIVDSSVKQAIDMAKRNGGRVEGDKLIVKLQAAKPAKLELWDDYGSPAELMQASDARWQWKGDWRAEKGRRVTGAKGSEAAVDFEGTGFIVVGPYLARGGKAEVFLDGKSQGTVDVYPDENAEKGGESVFHAFNLKPGRHTLRLVVLGQPYGASSGTDVAIDRLIVFR